MANVYINSNAVGANTGVSKVDAYALVESAIDNFVSGDSHLLSHLHSQSSAIDFDASGADYANPFTLTSIDFADDTPRESAGIQLTRPSGNMQFKGFNILVGVSISNPGGVWLNDAAGEVHQYGGTLILGASINYMLKGIYAGYNVDFQLPAGGYLSGIEKSFSLFGGSFSSSSGANPTIITVVNQNVVVAFDGVDMSSVALGAGNFVRSADKASVTITNCKLPTFTKSQLYDTTTGSLSSSVKLVNSPVRGEIRHIYADESSIESTVAVYRSTSPTVYESPSRMSYLVSPSSQINRHNRLTSVKLIGIIPLAAVGTVTLRVEIAHNLSSALLAKDVSLVLGYADDLGSAGLSTSISAIGFGDSSNVDPLPTSAEAWVGVPGYTLQYIELEVTVAEAGQLHGTLFFGRGEPGQNIYHDAVMQVM